MFLREEVGSVSSSVDLEKPGLSVETKLELWDKGVTTGDEALE